MDSGFHITGDPLSLPLKYHNNRSLVHKQPNNNRACFAPLWTDSIFHIVADTITDTFSYAEKGSTLRIRYTTPVHKIKNITYDDYLVLDFEEELAQVYKQKNNDNRAFVESNPVLHIGAAEENNKQDQQAKKRGKKHGPLGIGNTVTACRRKASLYHSNGNGIAFLL